MNLHRLAAACALTLAAALPAAHATTVPLSVGSWALFNADLDYFGDQGVRDYNSDDFAAAHFSFTIASGFQGTLTLVDLGFSGDAFTLRNGATVLGSSSLGVNGDTSGAAEFNADAALANSAFGRASFTLGAGSYDITGALSASSNGLNASTGALKLEVSPVPEPATLATLLAGLSLLTVVLRRRDGSK